MLYINYYFYAQSSISYEIIFYGIIHETFYYEHLYVYITLLNVFCPNIYKGKTTTILYH